MAITLKIEAFYTKSNNIRTSYVENYVYDKILSCDDKQFISLFINSVLNTYYIKYIQCESLVTIIVKLDRYLCFVYT